MPRRKSRGVRCARFKLNSALANSQLARKTQIALAEAVADLEQLEAVPKDLVSKMFRELPVDVQTVERVAKVLQVEARSLYHDEILLTQDSEVSTETPQMVNWRENNRKAIVVSFFATGLVGLLFLFFILPDHTAQSDDCSRPISSAAVTDNQHYFTLLIGRFVGDSNN